MDGLDQDHVLLLVREQDMRKRMENGQKLIDHLSFLEGNLKWDNVDRIIDSLSTYWVSSSNFKVALLGLDIISLLVERLGDSFQSHYNTLQNALVDRLGDQKEQVRTASITLFTNIMEAAASPQFVFERLATTFSHKVWRVREGMCGLLIETINRFGARSLHLNKLVPHICKLLSDSNAQVRDIALSTLVEIYKHVGEKVRQDLMKRGLPPNRTALILDRFDEVLNAGEMVTEEIETGSVTSSGSFGSTGSTTVTSSSGIMKPPASTIVPNSNRASSAVGRVLSSESRGSTSSNRISHSAVGRRSVAPAKSTMEVGAVDEDTFNEAMEKGLPKIHLYNQRDFDDTMTKIFNIISDEKKDWEERAKALKNLRAVLVAGGSEYDSFHQNMRMMEPALRLNVRDLRSQVVRETCLTIGLLSTILKNRFDHTAEILFPTLFNLVPNSVKIMATSGVTTIRIILKNTHATRLIPIITGNCNSKSTAVRRKTFCFLDLILQEWSTSTLEKNLAVLTEAVRKGIMDADSEARSDARKAWWGLHTHFPNEADKLFHTLTSSQQKMIQGQLTASSSTDSIPRSTSSDSHTSVSKRTRTSLLPPQRVSTAGRTVSTAKTGATRTNAMSNKFLRSRSDIDPSAAKRSSVKAMSYSSIGRTRPPAYSTANSKTPDKRGRASARPATSQPAGSSFFLPDSSPVSQIHTKTPREIKSLLSAVLVRNAENFEPNETNGSNDECQHIAIGASGSSLPGSEAGTKKKPFSRLSKTLPTPSRLKKISSEKCDQKSEPLKNSNLRLGRSNSFQYKNTFDSKRPNHSAVSKGPPAERPLSPNSRVNELFLSRSDSAGSRSNSPNSKFRNYNPTRTPGRPSRMQTMSAEDNSDYGGYPMRVSQYNPTFKGYSNGPQRVPLRTPPSSPTATPQRSRIPVSTSRSGSRVGSRTGSRVGSPSGSRGASPPRYRVPQSRIPRSEPVSRNRSHVASSQVSSRDSSPGTGGRGSTSGGTGQAMRVLPKGREGEQVLTDALLGRKTPKRRGESYGYSDDGDDFSDTSSVCSDRSSSYQSRNGVRRPHSHTEDIADILTLCQSSNWADRKEGLLCLHVLIKKEKLISRMEMKKILEIFNRMFADPHGKVFSLFLEILPDFVSTYKEHIEDWLYVLMTQLLKKMGADLLGSVQAKVVKAMQTTRVSFPPQQQFNILTRYIVDQTQTPNFKVKVALLHYLMDLIALMEPSDINSTSETRLAITRIITWTTEPKSQDVRKASEAVVIDLFELNPGEFTMMLRILPKTFQDGAMKVLQHHMKSNGELRVMTPTQPTNPGRITARIGMSPSGTVVSPHGSISGLADVMSPRGSDCDFTSSENTRHDNVEENLNFGEITAEIHKLRLDSSADGMDYTLKQKNSLDNVTGAGDGNSLPQVFFPPPFQQLQNTPKQLSGNRGMNKYHPGIYSEKINSPSVYNKEALKEAIFDDDDTISDEYSQDDSAILSQLTSALQKKSQRKLALLDFRKALRSGDPKLVLSGKSYHWEHYIVPLLMHIIDCMRDEEAETRVLALSILKDMFLRISSETFSDYIETIIYTVLEAHKDKNSEVTRAAEDAATTLGSFLPSDLCFQILIPFMGSEQFQTMQITIKMLTNAITKSNKTELTPNIVNSLVPYLIKGYDSSESSMRKAAVFCLVALHQVIGEDELAMHLSSLSGSKMKLLQLYIKRAQAASH